MEGPLLPFDILAASQTDISPTDNIPTRFAIGKSTVDTPLVSLQQTAGHLALLHAFAGLKNAVDAATAPSILGVTLTNEQRWSWFVGCAVERFDIWVHALRSTNAAVDIEIVMPPLDVIMVWHTYMLNPRWFAEDSIRRTACGNLRLLERHFTECMNGQFSVILNQPPSESRVNFWRDRTAQPFEYSLDGVTNAIKQKSLKCHFCHEVLSVDLINPNGTGYLQESFSFTCPNPHIFRTITKETLAVRKLASDLAGPTASPGLSAGLTTSTKGHADAIKTAVTSKVKDYGDFQKYPVESPQYVDGLTTAILEAMQASTDSLTGLVGKPSRIYSRIMAAYFDEKDYSIELVGAVLRQEAFVSTMYKIGATRSRAFRAEIDAVGRYHNFLDLLSSSLSFFVPTLDIDLVWHTHQLMPTKYQEDCVRYVGRFIDHDDNVDGLHLASSFDMTCRAWKSRFDAEYSLGGLTSGSSCKKNCSGGGSCQSPASNCGNNCGGGCGGGD